MFAIVLCMSASAFAPVAGDDGVSLEPQRIEWTHPGEQARLSRTSRAWAAFTAAEGAGWVVRWDEVTRTPRELYGTGIPVRTDSESLVVRDVRDRLVARSQLLGFDPAQLRLKSVSHHEPSDTWYVDFTVERDPGVPTYRGGLSVRVKHGNLILIRNASAPDSPVTGAFSIDAAKAQALAISAGPAPDAVHTDTSATPMLLERYARDEGLVLRRTWQTRSRTAEPPGIWVSFVDAETGELLNVHNEVQFVTGNVTARHHESSPLGPFVSGPMPLVRVSGSAETYTDDAGEFTLNGGPYESRLNGDYLTVSNQSGEDGVLRSSSANMEWDSGDATQAEIDTYVFTHQAREWALAVDPSSQMANQNLAAYVNINDVCNAYFDGNINFFRSGYGCTNTGENRDVVHHEWGHGFHYYQIRAGYFDGSLSEGAADTVAFFQSGSNLIGPGFFNNGNAIRDVGPNQVYPDDYVNDDRYVHSNGLIFGGSIWDMWDLLVDTDGIGQGTDIAESIFAGLLRGGPGVATSFGEALVADDDDGNLGNGTPHACQIISGFAQHGLAGGATASGSLSLVATHEPVAFTLPAIETQVRFDLPSGNDCFSGLADDAVVRFRVNEGDWDRVNGRTTDGVIRADLPPFEDGDFVEYWMEGTDTDGNTFRSPGSGRIAPFTMYVGETVEVNCERFATSADFHGKILTGDDGNPWQYGPPQGQGGDAPTAQSGKNVWGTALDGNGLYQPNSTVRLRSPEFETRHYTDVFLQYQRWLGVEDKAYDRATIELNGEQVWGNGGDPEFTGTTRDDQWVSHVVDLDGGADRGVARVDFLLDSDEGVEFGGWNIDDLCLLAPATPDNRLGISDLAIEEGDGEATLTWTQPQHAPVETVVLVKRTDRFPENWLDGTVVASFGEVELGAPIEVRDDQLAAENYYAVYASDGTDWLSFTIEGFNAVDLVPADENVTVASSGTGGSTGGCGCDSAAGSGGLAALGAVVMVLRRRRC